MPDLDPLQFVPMFRTEALDRLRRVREGLAGLERDLANPAPLELCRREMHTIKGAAGMVHQPAVAQQARALEERLLGLVQQPERLTPEDVTQLRQATAQLQASVEALGAA